MRKSNAKKDIFPHEWIKTHDFEKSFWKIRFCVTGKNVFFWKASFTLRVKNNYGRKCSRSHSKLKSSLISWHQRLKLPKKWHRSCLAFQSVRSSVELKPKSKAAGALNSVLHCGKSNCKIFVFEVPLNAVIDREVNSGGYAWRFTIQTTGAPWFLHVYPVIGNFQNRRLMVLI